MRMIIRLVASTILLSSTSALAASAPSSAVVSGAEREAGPPNGTVGFDKLVALFQEFDAWKDPEPVNGVIDYSPQTVERRRSQLRAFQQRLPDFAVARWDRHQQVDYLAVRAQLDQQDFLLNVTKPWARDPGMYVDDLQRLAYTELPVAAAGLPAFQQRLRTIPAYLAQAQVNLDSVPADYADLAIHSLSHGDGVGHGMPYRAVEPAGLMGWFADLRSSGTQ